MISDCISSGVYRLHAPAAVQGKAERIEILRGSTSFLTSLIVSAVSLAPGADCASSGPEDRDEAMFIVLSGKLEATAGGLSRRLGPRGVAQIMPGSPWSLRNTGAEPASAVEMRYRSGARGGGAGEIRLIDREDLACIEHERGKLWRYFDRPTAMTKRFEVHVTALKPGIASHAPHRHPPEEIVLLLEGDAIVTTGKARQPARVGDIVYWRSDESHALENTGAGPCIYFAIQWE